jgi:hypothetical protein
MLDSCGLQRLDDYVSYSHPCHGFHPEVRAQQGQSGGRYRRRSVIWFQGKVAALDNE